MQRQTMIAICLTDFYPICFSLLDFVYHFIYSWEFIFDNIEHNRFIYIKIVVSNNMQSIHCINRQKHAVYTLHKYNKKRS